MPPIRKSKGRTTTPDPKTGKLSPWQEFLAEYKNGCGSQLCDNAHRICLARGSVPCDILFVGEGPGEAENLLGKPFIGPAGKLLDIIIKESIVVVNEVRTESDKAPLKYGITNLVGCIPREGLREKALEPLPEDIECCKPRLEWFIELCDPQVVICLGKLPAQYLRQGYKHSIKLVDRETPVVNLMHPSWALRQDQFTQYSYIRRCAVSIVTEIRGLP